MAPLNGSKFTLVERTPRKRSSKSATLDRAFALLHARSIILPAGLLAKRDASIRRLERAAETGLDYGAPHFGNPHYAWVVMRVARAYTHGYIRTFDGLIDRPIAPYLFIFHRVLAPGTISSFSFHCVRTRGGKKYEILTPTLSTRVALYQFFFFPWHRRNLYQNRSTVIFPPDEKNEAADVPGLLTPAIRSGKLFWKSKYRCDRMDLISYDS